MLSEQGEGQKYRKREAAKSALRRRFAEGDVVLHYDPRLKLERETELLKKLNVDRVEAYLNPNINPSHASADGILAIETAVEEGVEGLFEDDLSTAITPRGKRRVVLTEDIKSTVSTASRIARGEKSPGGRLRPVEQERFHFMLQSRNIKSSYGKYEYSLKTQDPHIHLDETGEEVAKVVTQELPFTRTIAITYDSSQYGSSGLTMGVDVREGAMPGKKTLLYQPGLDIGEVEPDGHVVLCAQHGSKPSQVTTEQFTLAVAKGIEVPTTSHQTPRYKEITLDKREQAYERANMAVDLGIYDLAISPEVVTHPGRLAWEAYGDREIGALFSYAYNSFLNKAENLQIDRKGMTLALACHFLRDEAALVNELAPTAGMPKDNIPGSGYLMSQKGNLGDDVHFFIENELAHDMKYGDPYKGSKYGEQIFPSEIAMRVFTKFFRLHGTPAGVSHIGTMAEIFTLAKEEEYTEDLDRRMMRGDAKKFVELVIDEIEAFYAKDSTIDQSQTGVVVVPEELKNPNNPLYKLARAGYMRRGQKERTIENMASLPPEEQMALLEQGLQEVAAHGELRLARAIATFVGDDINMPISEMEGIVGNALAKTGKVSREVKARQLALVALNKATEYHFTRGKDEAKEEADKELLAGIDAIKLKTSAIVGDDIWNSVAGDEGSIITIEEAAACAEHAMRIHIGEQVRDVTRTVQETATAEQIEYLRQVIISGFNRNEKGKLRVAELEAKKKEEKTIPSFNDLMALYGELTQEDAREQVEQLRGENLVLQQQVADLQLQQRENMAKDAVTAVGTITTTILGLDTQRLQGTWGVNNFTELMRIHPDVAGRMLVMAARNIEALYSPEALTSMALAKTNLSREEIQGYLRDLDVPSIMNHILKGANDRGMKVNDRYWLPFVRQLCIERFGTNTKKYFDQCQSIEACAVMFDFWDNRQQNSPEVSVISSTNTTIEQPADQVLKKVAHESDREESQEISIQDYKRDPEKYRPLILADKVRIDPNSFEDAYPQTMAAYIKADKDYAKPEFFGLIYVTSALQRERILEELSRDTANTIRGEEYLKEQVRKMFKPPRWTRSSEFRDRPRQNARLEMDVQAFERIILPNGREDLPSSEINKRREEGIL